MWHRKLHSLHRAATNQPEKIQQRWHQEHFTHITQHSFFSFLRLCNAASWSQKFSNFSSTSMGWTKTRTQQKPHKRVKQADSPATNPSHRESSPEEFSNKFRRSIWAAGRSPETSLPCFFLSLRCFLIHFYFIRSFHQINLLSEAINVAESLTFLYIHAGSFQCKIIFIAWYNPELTGKSTRMKNR